MAEQTQSVSFRLIQPGDRLTGLSLGNEKFLPLKTFLQRHASAFQIKSLARTYAAFTPENKVVGYITLVCGEVVIGEDDHQLVSDVEYNYRHYPAVKIARLATDKKYRAFGIGTYLVQLALGIAQDTISPAVGCRFVVVDAKQEAIKFYERRGFTLLDTEENKGRDQPVMFVDLQKTS